MRSQKESSDTIATIPTPKQLAIKALFEQFNFLGTDAENYYFISNTQQKVISTTCDKLRPPFLFRLADRALWESLKKTGVSLDEIQGLLMQESHKAGVYDKENTRGLGFHMDRDGNLVRHAGNKLIKYKPYEEMPLRGHNSGLTFERAKPVKTITETLTPDDLKGITGIVSLLYWQKDYYAQLFLGWLVLAPFCGARPWVPHIMLNAPAGAGKTMLADFCSGLLGKDNLVNAKGDTSGVGVVQHLKNNALPVYVDEAEMQTHKGKARVNGIIQVARNSSVNDGALELKGTGGGEGRSVTTRTCFAFAGINTHATQAADQQRITTLELKLVEHTEETEERFKYIDKALKVFRDKNIGERLINFTASHYEALESNIDLFSGLIAEDTGNARSGKQYGSLIAGYALLKLEGVAATREEAIRILEDIDIQEHKAENEEAKPSTDVIVYLLNRKVGIEGLRNYGQQRIGRLIAMLTNPDSYTEELEQLGSAFSSGSFGLPASEDTAVAGCKRISDTLKIYGFIYQLPGGTQAVGGASRLYHSARTKEPIKNEGVFIATTNQALKELIREPQFEKWSTSLKNNPDAMQVSERIRFNGQQTHAYFLPISFFID